MTTPVVRGYGSNPAQKDYDDETKKNSFNLFMRARLENLDATGKPFTQFNVYMSELREAEPSMTTPSTTTQRELRNMADSTFLEEWLRPESKRRYPFNDLLAEAMKRGYNAEGKQVRPATQRDRMTFCNEREGGCASSLTTTDFDCGYCTNCGKLLRPLTEKASNDNEAYKTVNQDRHYKSTGQVRAGRVG